MPTDQTIRSLTSADRDILWAFIQEDPPANLFQIADLEQFGLDDPGRLTYYGAFRQGRLVANLMRYRTHYCVYWRDPAPLPAFAQIARREGITFCTGVPAQVEPFLAQFPPGLIEKPFQQRYYRLAPGGLRASDQHGARRVGWDDLDALAEFYAQGFFAHLEGPTTPEGQRSLMARSLEAGQVIYAIYEGQRIVSAAHTTALGREFAMIGGVATLESHRNRGLCTSCMAALCADLLGRGVTPYLFWHNPAAGRVYDKVGFQDIGTWLMVKFREGM